MPPSGPQPIPVNMYETSGALVVIGVVPAVTTEDVTVERTGRTLRLRARLRNATEREYLLHEWSYGDYERDLDLPDGYRGGVEASLVNGQLVVRVLAGDGAGDGDGGTVSVVPSGRHGGA